MWERTVTIGSAGKTFSVTGWKSGWAYGPANIMKNLFIVHQNCVNSCITPIQVRLIPSSYNMKLEYQLLFLSLMFNVFHLCDQEAIARSLELEFERFGKPECYLQSLAVELVAKRDFIVRILSEVGMVPVIPEGGYFIIADWSPLSKLLYIVLYVVLHSLISLGLVD